MSESPLVTYLLILYNQERYAAEAVRSALAQTYSPLEIVISDDGSTDGTWATIESAVRDYRGPHKIILNRNDPNVGIGEHFNRIVPLGSGEWCVVAAGDDVSDPRRVEMLLQACSREKNLKAAFSKYERIDEEGSPLATNFPPHFQAASTEIYDMRRWLILCRKYGYLAFSGCTAMWHRSLFDDFGKLDQAVISEDVVLGFRALLTGRILVHEAILVKYRVHGGNISGAASTEGLEKLKHYAKSIQRSKPSFQSNLRDLHSLDCREFCDFVEVETIVKNAISLVTIEGSWWTQSLVSKLKSIGAICGIGGFRLALSYLPRLLPIRHYLFYLRRIRRKQTI